MEKSLSLQFFMSSVLRYWLCQSNFKTFLQERVEISTPINSWKNLIEGVTLLNDGINPYVGDLFHENPLILHLFTFFLHYIPDYICFVYILCDLITALLLYAMSRSYVLQMLTKQDKNKKQYAKNISRILLNLEDYSNLPKYVVLAYLYNPYTIMNCICFTSTVFSNLCVALFFYSFVTNKVVLSSVSLAFTLLLNVYPITLIVPASIHFHQIGRSWKSFVSCFVMIFVFLIYVCLVSMNYDFSFIEATYGFQFMIPNLQPNIGLFWYFFTEMFEHFRNLFIAAFQINAICLYAIPLSLRLSKEPILVAIVLTGLATVFKSYPCIGDVALYISLMPLCKYLFPFMQQGFVVACFFIGCSIFAPTVWHLWIYSRSANANFYFGVTLAFATSQIFLLTDLLFAYLKRDYSLNRGLRKLIKGKPARLILD